MQITSLGNYQLPKCATLNTALGHMELHNNVIKPGPKPKSQKTIVFAKNLIIVYTKILKIPFTIISESSLL